VTTPQDIALLDARKGLKMFEKVGIPIIGIVENMSIHVCSNCGHAEHIFGAGGGEKMCADYGVPFLGALPLDKSAALIDAVTREAVPLKLAPVAKIEHWPGASHPRLTVATLAMSDEFVTLDWRVRSTMIALGLPVDARTFRPHVTLARYRREAGAVGHAAELPAGLVARFEALTLYSSTLARNGARYRSLASAHVVYA